MSGQIFPALSTQCLLIPPPSLIRVFSPYPAVTISRIIHLRAFLPSPQLYSPLSSSLCFPVLICVHVIRRILLRFLSALNNNKVVFFEALFFTGTTSSSHVYGLIFMHYHGRSCTVNSGPSPSVSVHHGHCSLHPSSTQPSFFLLPSRYSRSDQRHLSWCHTETRDCPPQEPHCISKFLVSESLTPIVHR